MEAKCVKMNKRISGQFILSDEPVSQKAGCYAHVSFAGGKTVPIGTSVLRGLQEHTDRPSLDPEPLKPNTSGSHSYISAFAHSRKIMPADLDEHYHSFDSASSRFLRFS